MVNSGYREENGELKAPKPDDHHHVAVLMERVGRANGLNAIEAPPKSNCPRVARNYGMTASTEEPVQRTAAGWRWLLYVALAIVGALLTFVGARAQQKATDDATFRKLIDSYCVAWSTGTAEAPAKFYAKEDGLVFYDVAPFAYHSWKEYHDGVQKEFLEGASEIKLTAGKDLKVSRRGTIAWMTVPMHLMEKSKDGKTTEMEAWRELGARSRASFHSGGRKLES